MIISDIGPQIIHNSEELQCSYCKWCVRKLVDVTNYNSVRYFCTDPVSTNNILNGLVIGPYPYTPSFCRFLNTS